MNRGYLGFFFFSVKDRNLFHRVDTIGNIFTSGAATSENITDGGAKILQKILRKSSFFIHKTPCSRKPSGN